MYDIQTLKQDITGMLHGTTANQIVGLTSDTNYNLINRAARQLLLDLDPQETKRIVEFVGPIFNSVFDYPSAADVKGNKIIDIFPQVQRIPQDVWLQSYNQAFDVFKQNLFSMQNMFTINFNSSLKTIRINAPWLNPPVILNQAESTTNNGTWTAGGTASSLSTNNTNFAQGAGSLQFNATTGAAYVENSTSQAVNLSTVVNQSYLFVWVYVPTASLLTSVELRWGSSSSNYYTVTATQTQQGTTFQNGWNLCQFPWTSASTVGSPDSSSITYLRVTLNVTGSETACLVNGINSILGTILSYEYYSKYLFRNSTTGTYQETVLDDSDLINLDTESYNLLTYQCAYLAFQQQQGLDASFYDGNFAKQAYDAGVLRYKAMYKSELQKPQSTYYSMPYKGYGRFFGQGGWW